jgi:hypothetical protein
MGARTERLKRAIHVARVARRGKLFRVLREVGVVGERPATVEGAREFRNALEELGTTYVKLGQLLSSRSDLLPDVYIEELSRLVDEVPPVPFADIERVLYEDLDRDLFATVDPEPLAAASIAQIHRAQLANGLEVAVKVRRPHVEEVVARDPIALLEEDALTVMLEEAESRLEPRALRSYIYVQLDALSRLPRRVAQVVDRLETGTVKVRIVPTDLGGFERLVRSAANRVGAALMVVGLLVASALMAGSATRWPSWGSSARSSSASTCSGKSSARRASCSSFPK